MGKIVAVAVSLVAVILVGVFWAVPAYKSTQFTVLFPDAKGLVAKDNVYLAGTRVGQVRSVDLRGDDVAVRVRLDRDFKDQIAGDAAFFIDRYDSGKKSGRCLLVRQGNIEDGVVSSGDVVRGVDSLLRWKALEYRGAVRNMMQSETASNLLNSLENTARNIKARMEEVDWAALELQVHQDLELLLDESRKLKEREEVVAALAAIELRMQEIGQALDEVKDSEEAQKLHTALDDFYARLRNEIDNQNKTENNDRNRVD